MDLKEQLESEREGDVVKSDRELTQQWLCERHSFVADCEWKIESKGETEDKERQNREALKPQKEIDTNEFGFGTLG